MPADAQMTPTDGVDIALYDQAVLAAMELREMLSAVGADRAIASVDEVLAELGQAAWEVWGREAMLGRLRDAA